MCLFRFLPQDLLSYLLSFLMDSNDPTQYAALCGEFREVSKFFNETLSSEFFVRRLVLPFPFALFLKPEAYLKTHALQYHGFLNTVAKSVKSAIVQKGRSESPVMDRFCLYGDPNEIGEGEGSSSDWELSPTDFAMWLPCVNAREFRICAIQKMSELTQLLKKVLSNPKDCLYNNDGQRKKEPMLLLQDGKETTEPPARSLEKETRGKNGKMNTVKLCVDFCNLTDSDPLDCVRFMASTLRHLELTGITATTDLQNPNKNENRLLFGSAVQNAQLALKTIKISDTDSFDILDAFGNETKDQRRNVRGGHVLGFHVFSCWKLSHGSLGQLPDLFPNIQELTLDDCRIDGTENIIANILLNLIFQLPWLKTYCASGDFTPRCFWDCLSRHRSQPHEHLRSLHLWTNQTNEADSAYAALLHPLSEGGSYKGSLAAFGPGIRTFRVPFLELQPSDLENPDGTCVYPLLETLECIFSENTPQKPFLPKSLEQLRLKFTDTPTEVSNQAQEARVGRWALLDSIDPKNLPELQTFQLSFIKATPAPGPGSKLIELVGHDWSKLTRLSIEGVLLDFDFELLVYSMSPSLARNLQELDCLACTSGSESKICHLFQKQSKGFCRMVNLQCLKLTVCSDHCPWNLSLTLDNDVVLKGEMEGPFFVYRPHRSLH